METVNEVKERPILFSGPMVRAILDGRKTQTRRTIKNSKRHWSGTENDGFGGFKLNECPYGQPGDRLWVRETWCLKHDGDGFVYNKDGNRDSSCVWYRADGTEVVSVDGDGFSQWNQDGTAKSPWSPSIHMPRWASRITLEITDIRVERLNDISRDDAKAEGIERVGFSEHAIDTPGGEEMVDLRCWRNYTNPRTPFGSMSQIHSFASLWESINGEGSWDENPYVWVVEFKKVTNAKPQIR